MRCSGRYVFKVKPQTRQVIRTDPIFLTLFLMMKLANAFISTMVTFERAQFWDVENSFRCFFPAKASGRDLSLFSWIAVFLLLCFTLRWRTLAFGFPFRRWLFAVPCVATRGS